MAAAVGASTDVSVRTMINEEEGESCLSANVMLLCQAYERSGQVIELYICSSVG